MKASLALAGAVTGSLALALLLSGCQSSGTPDSSSTTAATTTPTPTPTPTDSAEAKNVLFTISANVRSSDGSTIAIRLTAHTPLPYSNTESKTLQTEFVKACGAGLNGVLVTPGSLASNGSILMSIDLATSANGKEFAYPLDLALGSPYFGQSASGKGIAPTDAAVPCYNGYRWSIAGAGHAIADFESGNPGPTLDSWKYAFYGFGVPESSKTTIEACKVTLSDAAKKAVADTDGWDPTQVSTGITCGIGYRGE